jgi:hypothetical protein
MTRRIARTAFATAGAMLLALSFAAGPLHADLNGPGTESWTKLLAYAGCAISIAAASSGLGLAATIVMCVRLFIIEP